MPAIFTRSLASLPVGSAQFVLPLLSSFLIAGLVTWGLQGVIFVQTYNYFLSFPNDPHHMKIVVYGLFALELAQTLMVTRDTYSIFATGFADFAGLDNLHLLPVTLPILGGVAGFICHAVFAYRISILAQSRWIGGGIMVLATVGAIFAIVFGGKLFAAGSLSNLLVMDNIYLVCGMWNGFGAFCDVVIALSMSFYLSRNHTGFANTDVLITRIIRMTVETGAATATASITSAILFIGFRQDISKSVYFVVPATMITKLYAITILATFNNRPQAVGGPPANDSEVAYDLQNRRKSSPRIMEQPSKNEICIGRTIVQEVWDDPVSTIYQMNDGQSVKRESSEYTGSSRPDSVILNLKSEDPQLQLPPSKQ